MRIHDKYVIELAEVIKGYGNDYQVKEPCNLPCDYKFYEISGVAICEESFKKMKPLTEEVNSVLDKIKEEIKDNTYFINEITEKEGIDFETVEKIINRYKAESEKK